ncbi:hypothetical protein BGZ70_000912 [Mortierella alpina]|uniref:Uncharacterized protein n=1 Tax=Mortierella alpina TaxID=64518 RepID=A0A9P6JBW0_MORAP|nr:hypothetical protein BGZ70_000912 [Mortierella alpina]
MLSASITRGIRRALAQPSRISLHKASPSQHRILLLDARISRSCYSTTPVMFSKFENQNQPTDKSKTPGSAPSTSANKPAATANGRTSQDDDAQKSASLLSGSDDLMVGNEGLETIDPKDFPELYPGEEDIEGLSQASHPDNERDFEGMDRILEDNPRSTSVLLSDKARTEEEFSWFVDETYPEQAGENQEEKSARAGEFVPLWQKNAQRAPDGSLEADSQDHPLEHSPDSVSGLVKLLEAERARNVKVIDMRDKCDWTNWMVIAEGLSERHLGNVADQVYSALKKSSPKTSPPVMEGRDTSDWVVIDAGSVIIHFMTPEARKERDLEGLWASVKNPLKLKDAEDISWEDVKGKMTKSWKENTGRSKGEDGKRGRRGERDIPLSEVVKW